MHSPLISIIYPVFNDNPVFIEQSLNSLLAQDYLNFEIIIVDDSTEGRTLDCINRFSEDKRIRLIREKNTLGLSQALNIGIRVAQGIYIARADADDISTYDRLRTQVNFLEKYQDIDVVGSNIIYINNDGQKLKMRKYPETNESIYRYIHLRNPLAHPTVMFRKCFFDTVGYYNIQLKRAEDYDLWFRAKKQNIKIYNIQAPLVYYRISNVQKRDNLNWKSNLQLKLENFSFKHFIPSTFGVFSLFLFLILPSFLKEVIYKKLS